VGRVLPLVSLAILTAAILVTASQPQFIGEFWGDEFLLPWYGKQVANGRVPYTDFFLFLGPLAAYGSGLLTIVAGVGVVPFRLLNILLSAAATLGLFGIIRRRGASPRLAWIVAAWYPVIIISLWPMLSHQWIAVNLGIISVWIAVSSLPGFLRAFIASLIAVCTGLTVQTIGAVALPVVIAIILCDRKLSRKTKAAGLALGAALPIGVCGVLLLQQGALHEAIEYAVMWPLRFYEQPGGFNDGSLRHLMQQRPLPTPLDTAIPASNSLTLALFLPLGLIALASLLLDLWGNRASAARRRQTLGFLSIVSVALVLFESGRSDVPHLAYYSAIFLVVLSGAAAGENMRARLVRVFLVIGLSVGLVRWVRVWSDVPPDIAAVLSGDEYAEQRVYSAFIDALPRAQEDQLPVVYLSRAASVIYLYWSPRFPPVDWLAPPSWATNSAEEYERAAHFIQANRIPYLVVGRSEAGFLTDPSPLKRVLAESYRLDREIAAGWVFVRHSDGIGANIHSR
jgi:hypothetical protein